MSETWLKSDLVINLSILGYEFIHVKSDNRAGGVAMHVSNKFSFEITNQFDLECDDCQNIWIKLKHNNTKRNYAEVAYRYFTNSHEYLIDTLNDSIMRLTKNKIVFYLTGNFNINIAPDASNSSANTLKNMLLSNSVYPLLTIPTRVTDNSQTIIDNIFTNDANALLPGILQTDVSDHFAVFVFSLKHPKPRNAEATYLRRNKTKFDSKAFCQDLELKLVLNTQLKSVSLLNFNQLLAKFLQTVEGTVEQPAPLKKLTRKQRKLQAKP